MLPPRLKLVEGCEKWSLRRPTPVRHSVRKCLAIHDSSDLGLKREIGAA
jgi:hypothetical protein